MENMRIFSFQRPNKRVAMAHITREQRYTIECLLAKGKSITYIAETIGKNKSVVSREIKRNTNERTGIYSSKNAQKYYETRQKWKHKRTYMTDSVKATIRYYLELDYSPEQIVGFCRKNDIPCVSHESIYQHIWKCKANGQDLHLHLRRKGRRYQKRGSQYKSRGTIVNRRDIDERPTIVEERKRFGDLEIDTIIGKNHKGAIVTINDRASGMLWMKKTKSRSAEDIVNATIELLYDERDNIHTITADNGKEFAYHSLIAEILGVDFYFAHPYKPWQRGANENLNGLIRQYIPKKTDFTLLEDKLVSFVQNILNNRPRKRLDFDNPITRKKNLLF
jgi:IS30 family transposase